MKTPIDSLPSVRPWHPGVTAALGSAVLFGAGTPLAKLLLDSVSPWLLAGLLYLGSGLGLALYRRARQLKAPRLSSSEKGWMLAAVVCGGYLAPVLLMWGLSRLPASHTALLLNAEAVLTTLLAWALFKENLGTRIVLGMAAIVLGAVILAWPSAGLAPVATVSAGALWPALAVLGACALWALDNNFTRKVALAEASWVACVKGSVAGTTNLLLAFALGASWPAWPLAVAAMGVGLLAYGVSLTLFVVGLRHLGASRSGAYFSVAPFVGAVMAVLLLAEPVSWPLAAAATFMALGVWLHLTEQHGHTHAHTALDHEHAHTHDAHHLHDHTHDDAESPGESRAKRHSHRHQHTPLQHSHAHFPDAHHQHRHSD